MTAKKGIKNGVTCVIPALNEEKTIGNVIDAIQNVKEVTEILIVDDGSTDKTVERAKKKGVRTVSHSVNRGKGAAMQTGAEHATHDFLVYVDADLENLSPQKIRKLVRPLLKNEADFVKASYRYKGGRVAKLVVKPLLKILYPFIELEHPLSGEIALNRRKFKFDNLEDGWGIDIQLVLQAAKRKLRIKEVLLGTKEHKHQSLDALSDMSEQIIRTIFNELKMISHKYKLIFIDLDKTLIGVSSIEVFAKEWGFTKEFKDLQKQVKDGKIPDREITKTIARHFKGKTQKDIDAICKNIPINDFADKVIAKLRKHRYRVRIISAAYSPVVEHFAARLGVHDYVCPRLAVDENGKFTGKLKPSRFEDKNDECCTLYVCKKKAVDYVRKRFGFTRDECMAIGDGKSDQCMFDIAGLSLGLHTDAADIRIGSMAEILMYTN